MSLKKAAEPFLVRDTLLQIALMIAILAVSAVLTRIVARAMYITCARCSTLNARRRVHCRRCGEHLRQR